MKLKDFVLPVSSLLVGVLIWLGGWRLWDALRLWELMKNYTFQAYLLGAIAIELSLFLSIQFFRMKAKPKPHLKGSENQSIYKAGPQVKVSYASMMPSVAPTIPAPSMPTLPTGKLFLKKQPKAPTPSKADLSEITEIIVTKTPKGLTSYHQTFMSNRDYCEYHGKRYNEPLESTQHYPIGFWNWGLKLSVFYTRHLTLAKFFDWFKYGKKTSYPIGYIHKAEQADPLELKVQDESNFDYPEENKKIEWSQINYAISKNTTIEGTHRDIDRVLKGEWSLPSGLLLLAIIIIAVVAAIVVVSYFATGNHSGGAQVIQNITATNSTIPPVLSTPVPTNIIQQIKP